jgi:hypothetical protein
VLFQAPRSAPLSLPILNIPTSMMSDHDRVRNLGHARNMRHIARQVSVNPRDGMEM